MDRVSAKTGISSGKRSAGKKLELIDAGRPSTSCKVSRNIHNSFFFIFSSRAIAGSTAIFEDRSFERRFRDAYTVSQQVQGRRTNFETVGRHLLGLEVDTIFM